MEQSAATRFFGVLLAPFVAAWDALTRVLFGFFGFLEKLDPTGPIVKLAQRLGEWLAPLLQRLKEVFQKVAETLASAVRRPLELLTRLVQPIRTMLIGLMRRVTNWLRAAQEIANRVAESVAAVTQPVRDAWRRAGASMSRTYRRIVDPVVATARRMVGRSDD